jgi:iron(III) transport system permease protein
MSAIKNIFSLNKIIFYCFFLIIFGICLFPIFNLIHKTFRINEIDLIWNFLFEPNFYQSLKNSVSLSLATAFFSSIFALLVSYLIIKTDLKHKKFFKTLFSLPFAIPPYIGAISWILLANPSQGILNQIFTTHFINIYKMSGIIWVQTCFLFSFIYLPLNNSFERLDPIYEEAARISGANFYQTFLKIIFPLIFPTLMSGIIIVFLASMASFGVPALIGNPSGIYFLSTKIYTLQKMGTLQGLKQGSYISLFLIIISIICLWINNYFTKKNFALIGSKASRPHLLELKKLNAPINIMLWIIIFIILIMPILTIALSAFSKLPGQLGLFPLENYYSFSNFISLFTEVEEFWRALSNSFKLSSMVATVSIILGFIFALFRILKKNEIKGTGSFNFMMGLSYGLPGSIIGLAFIILAQQSFAGFSLYNSIWLIFLAYLCKDLFLAQRIVSDGLGQIHPHLGEAARVSGASAGHTGLKIYLPLVKGTLMSAWFLVFLNTFSELTITILLTGPHLETIGTLLFSLQEYGDLGGNGASALALIIIMLIFVGNLIIKKISNNKMGI